MSKSRGYIIVDAVKRGELDINLRNSSWNI